MSRGCRPEPRRCRRDQPAPSSLAAVGVRCEVPGSSRCPRRPAEAPCACRVSAGPGSPEPLSSARGVPGSEAIPPCGAAPTASKPSSLNPRLPQLRRMGLEGGSAALPGLCGNRAGWEPGGSGRGDRCYSALQFPLQVAAGVVPHQTSPPTPCEAAFCTYASFLF